MNEREKAFLDELTLLSQKHGLVIFGCGCCGSPSVDEAPADAAQGFYLFDTRYAGQLLFLSPSDDYHWNLYVNFDKQSGPDAAMKDDPA